MFAIIESDFIGKSLLDEEHTQEETLHTGLTDSWCQWHVIQAGAI